MQTQQQKIRELISIVNPNNVQCDICRKWKSKKNMIIRNLTLNGKIDRRRYYCKKCIRDYDM